MQSHFHSVQTLERIFQKPSRRNNAWKAQLNNLWQAAIAHLSVSSEPHVWCSEDAAGREVWNSYDPTTGQALHGVSASELRVWLEDRHYQNPSAYNL
ncbi:MULTISPECIES: hypothetical protein [unclassified Leptolyngbya]|uniref:hypothetical protein n=1 Tax=unclassified Leptolyngbya TaxID=2650499 RepID=UPI0016837525|nr:MULTISPECIES: hypothetical protein [unclassified Leptolyngbya]MBD1909446.1 hypothetical protein [Leptolyngbya sp. FACHB-8]MBD2155657.1 hypothetical protein [Leptolyngbya sp. FACHB-16]